MYPLGLALDVALTTIYTPTLIEDIARLRNVNRRVTSATDQIFAQLKAFASVMIMANLVLPLAGITSIFTTYSTLVMLYMIQNTIKDYLLRDFWRPREAYATL